MRQALLIIFGWFLLFAVIVLIVMWYQSLP